MIRALFSIAKMLARSSALPIIYNASTEVELRTVEVLFPDGQVRLVHQPADLAPAEALLLCPEGTVLP